MISNDKVLLIVCVAIVVLAAFVIYLMMNRTSSSYNPPEEQVRASPPPPPQQPKETVIPPFSGAPLARQAAPGEPVMVMFWGVNCGHCVKMKPAWAEAARVLHNRIKLVDCESQDPSIGQFQGIRGYPTVRLYPQGLDHLDNFIEYQGDRSVQSLVQFAENRGQ